MSERRSKIGRLRQTCFSILAIAALVTTLDRAEAYKVYISNEKDNTVSVIDTGVKRVVNTIGVGDQPAGIAALPSGAFVYVANAGANTVSVINTAANLVTATVNTAGAFNEPFGITAEPDGRFVYAANRMSNSVTTIRVMGNTVEKIISPVSQPEWLAATGGYVYVPSTNSAGIVTIIKIEP